MLHENLDGIVEISQWQGMIDPMEGVESKVEWIENRKIYIHMISQKMRGGRMWMALWRFRSGQA